MKTVKIKGMSCNHCKMNVEKTLAAIPGVAKVEVDLMSGVATYEENSPVAFDVVKAAIERIGFEVVE